MSYVLIDRHTYWEIRDEDAECVAGIVMSRFEVYNDKRKKIAIVASIDDAVPTLARHDKKNHPKWTRLTPALYAKLTRYGCLRLELDHTGRWWASRDDCPLCDNENRERARFSSLVEAKRAANAHMRDGYPSSIMVDDYLSWSADGVQGAC
jgi:hypothetical protein